MEIVADRLDLIYLKLLKAVFADGHPHPSRDGDSRELVGVTLRLTDIKHNFVTNAVRKASSVYAAAELLWYLSGSDDDRMVAYAPQFSRFLNDGHAFGAYGKKLLRGCEHFRMVCQKDHVGHTLEHNTVMQNARLTQLSPLAAAVAFLKRTPTTRQAVIPLFDASDLLYAFSGIMNDIPCTTTVQYLVRDEKLHCIVSMRSNDIWLGVPYDVFAWSSIQRLIAGHLGLATGDYVHNVGSMHLYERNEVRAREAVKWDDVSSKPVSYTYLSPHWTFESIRRAVVCEQETRKSGSMGKRPDGLAGTMPDTLAMLAACQFDPSCVGRISEETLKSCIPSKVVQEYRP